MEISFIFIFLLLSTLLAGFILLAFRETRKVGLALLAFFAVVFVLGIGFYFTYHENSTRVIDQVGETIPLPPAYQGVYPGSPQLPGVLVGSWFKLALLTIFSAIAVGVILFVLWLWSKPKTRPYGNAVFVAGLLFIVLLFIGLSPMIGVGPLQQQSQSGTEYYGTKWDAQTKITQTKPFTAPIVQQNPVNPGPVVMLHDAYENVLSEYQPPTSRFPINTRLVQNVLLPLPPAVVPDVSSPDAIQKRIAALEKAINGLTRMLGRLTADNVKEKSLEMADMVESKSAGEVSDSPDLAKKLTPPDLPKPTLTRPDLPKPTPVQAASTGNSTTAVAQPEKSRDIADKNAASPAKKPDWVGKKPFFCREGSELPDYYKLGKDKPKLQGNAYIKDVEVGPYTSRIECEANVPDAICDALYNFSNEYHQKYLYKNHISPEKLRKLAVAEWEENIQSSVGPMTQLHVLVNFDQKAKDFIDEARNNYIFFNNATGIGISFICLWLFLLWIWAYLKIDIATKGVYRTRLRIAYGSVILIVVIVVLVASLA
jgi:hypothetical protein